MRRRISLLISSGILLGACAEQPSAPSLAFTGSAASARADIGCVATNLVATSEAQLNALVATSQPGDVIAVSGMIQMSDAVRPRAGTTLTCAASGDGLATGPGYTYWDLIEILEPNVTVQGMRLIGHNVDVVYAERSRFEIDGVAVNGANARVLGNDVTCNGMSCVFFSGVSNATVADNVFTASDVYSGIHVQGGAAPYNTDGLQVRRNRLIATNHTGSPVFGAIRPRDGANMIISENTIVGPWSNGIATQGTLDATFERNTVDGARRYGLFVGAGINQGTGGIGVRRLLARNNTLSGAENAIRVNAACTNVFVANKLGSASGTPVFFTTTTGANNLMGGDNSVNVDNGSFDCDGDGTVDPNFLTGRKRAGAEAGPTMREVMPPSRRVTMQ